MKQSHNPKLVIHSQHFLHQQESHMKPRRSFSDTEATTSDESSRASYSFVSSPSSSYTEYEDVSTPLNELLSDKKSDALNDSEVIVVGPSSDRLGEVFERAQELLQREQAPEYKIENYFLRNHSSLDPIHRSTMMDWAFEVLEYSFPSPPRQSTHQRHLSENEMTIRRKRKHSIEALYLVYATFSYIDRISTLNDLNPDQFKLLSMVCLHIAAKTSGLFGNSEHEASWPMRLRYDADTIEQHQSYYNPCQSQDFSISSTPAVMSEDSFDEEREDVSGQTIFSTPTSSSSAASVSSLSRLESALHCKPRPSMKLLSLSSLCSLYGGYVHLDEMVNVEWTILQHGLQWKVTGVTVFDWLSVFLDLAKLRLPKTFDVDWHIVEEQALAQLEFAIEHPGFMTHPPSLVCFAAFLNAIEDYNMLFLPGMTLLDRETFEVMLCLDDDVVHDIRCALSDR